MLDTLNLDVEANSGYITLKLYSMHITLPLGCSSRHGQSNQTAPTEKHASSRQEIRSPVCFAVVDHAQDAAERGALGRLRVHALLRQVDVAGRR